MQALDDDSAKDATTPRGEPRRSQLRRILDENPEARGRVGRAIASLGGTVVLVVAVLGALLIWHLIRRARLIRERLGPPKDIRLPDPIDDSPPAFGNRK